jgi:hypothetical protein
MHCPWMAARTQVPTGLRVRGMYDPTFARHGAIMAPRGPYHNSAEELGLPSYDGDHGNGDVGQRMVEPATDLRGAGARL